MKKNELAARLQNLDLDDFPSQLASEARRAGLVVVLGVSSDTVEFHGAISDEIDVVLDASGRGTIYFDADGVLPAVDDVPAAARQAYYDRKKFAASIDAEWQKDGFSWVFSSVIPHSRFVALKDGARYSRGIVFDLYAAGVQS